VFIIADLFIVQVAWMLLISLCAERLTHLYCLSTYCHQTKIHEAFYMAAMLLLDIVQNVTLTRVLYFSRPCYHSHFWTLIKVVFLAFPLLKFTCLSSCCYSLGIWGWVVSSSDVCTNFW
jgi:hypothetical protein